MKTERVYTCLFLLMFFGKMLHLPVGPVMIILTGIAMALSYFFGGFYFFCDEKLKRQNLALSIIAGICLSVGPVAITYRLDYWPDSGMVLVASMILSFCILGLVVFLRMSAKEELTVYYKNMFSRSLAIFSVSVILYVIPVSALVHMQYWDNNELAEIASRYATYPDNEEYRKQYEAYTKTHTPSGKLIIVKPPVDKAQPQKAVK